MKRAIILLFLSSALLVAVYLLIHFNRPQEEPQLLPLPQASASDVLIVNTGSARSKPDPTPTAPIKQNEDDKLEQAILQAVDARQTEILGFLIYQIVADNFRYSDDGQWAAAWIGLWDEELQSPLPGEPGLVLAQRTGDGWDVTMPADARWLEWLKTAPHDLVSPEEKETWILTFEKTLDELPKAALGGYRLPWPKGQTRYLSRSVGHDVSFTSGNYHFSFDFYLPGQQWPVYASKGGTVFKYKVDVPTCYEYNCGQTLGNYIVIQDVTTYPVTYMVYLHFAYDSIPASLRVIGAPVLQGQLIGTANNTGMSWGNHLHYQVHTNTDYYGVALDITFDEVPINGGRPRVSPADPPYCKVTDVCDTFQSSYVSNNTIRGDLTPPTGQIVAPGMGDTVSASALYLAGTASDIGSGLASIRFVANFNNSWVDIGPVVTASPAVYEWNMCSAGVPDGPVSVAMRLQDRDGNIVPLAGLTHFTKNYACPPPPACSPSVSQAALYENLNYTGCQVFSAGEYPDSAAISVVGNDDTESVRVGSGVQATLYLNPNFKGRGETFIQDDANLQDNLIGSNTVSSVKVWARSQAPQAPVVNTVQLLYTVPVVNDVVTLAWENGGGAREYQVSLKRVADPEPVTTTWVDHPHYHFTALAAGDYEWQVRARNQAGESAWTDVRTFTISSPAPTLPVPVNAPYIDGMEAADTGTRWTKRGYFGLKTLSTLAHEGNNSWWYQGSGGDYDNDKRNYGDLTSPPVYIPSTGYYLRFWSRNETEGSGPYWDQRWVQISKDGGPFLNVYQLTDDPRQNWVHSPYIDLSAYAGSAIQVRFRFDSLDENLNAFPGWGIDDFSITNVAPSSCASAYEPNNTPAQAVVLTYGASLSAAICPPGDIDYYRFDGSAGDRVVVDINAFSIYSNLDPILYLLDSDGRSILAEHDDEVYGEMLDPHLGYLLPRDGTYYLKLLPWNHPGAGGSTFFYDLYLLTDQIDPQISIIFPSTGSYLPSASFDITADAYDFQSGIRQVEFFMHTSNWYSTGWTRLGADLDGSDGWKWTVNPATLAEQKGLAFYAVASDWAGNTLGAGAWDLGVDRTLPISAILPLPATQSSTAFKVEWTGSDSASGIARYDLQWNVNNSGWVDLALALNPDLKHYWIVGQANKSYAFRMRAVDNSGNVEAYPAAAETTTAIPGPSVFCSLPDPYEVDNQAVFASAYSLNTKGPDHNFCNTQASDRLNDVDWLSVNLSGGVRYYLIAVPSPSTAVKMNLYASDGATLLAQSQTGEFGTSTRLEWIPNQDSQVYIKIEHIDGRVAGNSVSYSLLVTDKPPIYLPLISR